MEIEDFKITKNKLFKFENVDIEIFQRINKQIYS